jgi:uncharacterized protein (TIGR02594 family)
VTPMWRVAIGTFVLCLCLQTPALANGEDGGSSGSIRVCDKQSGCRYVERGSAKIQVQQKSSRRREARNAPAPSTTQAQAPAPARTYNLTQTPEARLASFRWWRPFAAPAAQPEPSHTRTALASEASGQRGYVFGGAPDTRAEPRSSARYVPSRIWQPFAVSVTENELRPIESAEAREQTNAPARATRGGRQRVATTPGTEAYGSVGPVSAAAAPGGGSSLVMISEARKYIGMTGSQLGVKHRGVWCGEFMGRVARAAGVRTPANPNMAPDWHSAGQRISSPRVGAIALVSHRGRHIGHVGLVTGVDGNGNPIIISGNHNNRVVEIAYPRSRVVGYVLPSGG